MTAQSKIVAMFPGQGSQYVGMGQDLYQTYPVCKQVFDQAEEVLGIPLKKLCFEGPMEELTLTPNLQPCILTVSYGIWKVLQQHFPLQIDYFAGHSLGEYSALVCAGKLQFEDALRTVRLRGEFMQNSVVALDTAMAAVIGMDSAQLIELCHSLAAIDGVCEVVNFNSPGQQIISGTKSKVEAVCRQLADLKIRTMLLPVSAPFHSSLMAPARKKMQDVIEKLTLIDNETWIGVNLTGEWTRDYRKQFLTAQIDSPVLWEQTLTNAYQSVGMTRYLEVGPGKVLWGLARRTLPRDISLCHTEDLPQALSWLKPN